MRRAAALLTVALLPHAAIFAQEPPNPEIAASTQPKVVDSLNAYGIGAFTEVLKAYRTEPEISSLINAQTPDPKEASNDCDADLDPPFSDLLGILPKQRADDIARGHGFKDASHWQAFGQKLIAIRAINQISSDNKITMDDVQAAKGQMNTFESDLVGQ